MCVALLAAAAFAQEGPRPAGPGGFQPSVLVPYDEFRRLDAIARGESASAPGPYLTDAAFEISLAEPERALVRVTCSYRVPPGATPAGLARGGGDSRAAESSLAAGQPSLAAGAYSPGPLALAWLGLALVEGRAGLARLESEPAGARIAVRPGSVPRFLLASAPAPAGKVTLELLAPLQRIAGERKLVLTIPPASSCRIDLVGAAAEQARVEPALSTERLDAAGTRLRVLVAPGPVRISWGPAQTASGTGSLDSGQLTVPRLATRLVLSPDGLSAVTYLDLEGQRPSIRIQLPPGAFEATASGGRAEAAFDKQSGVLSLTYSDGSDSEVSRGRERLRLEYRLPMPAATTLTFQSPAIAGARPREAWLAFHGQEPIDVSIDPAATPTGAAHAVARPPADLLPARGQSTRLALRLSRPEAPVVLRLDRWPPVTTLRAVAGHDLSAQTTIQEDGKAITQLRMSIAAERAATMALAMAGPTTRAIETVLVDGRPAPLADKTSGTAHVKLRRGGLDGAPYPVEVHASEQLPQLGWFGRVTLHLPQSDVLVRQLSWRIVPPRDVLLYAFEGGFDASEAPPRSFPYRFGTEVAALLGSALLWLGLPGLVLAFVVAGLRRTPVGEQALTTAAGAASLVIVAVVGICLYALALPVYRNLTGSRPVDGYVRAPGEPAATDARPEPGAASMASAGPMRSPDEDGFSSRVPALPPDLAPTYAGPMAGLPDRHPRLVAPEAVEGRAAGSDAAGETITVLRDVWLGAAAASRTATAQAEPGLTVSFRYLERPLLPVLQGLSFVFGFAFFLLLSLLLTEPARSGANGALAAGAFLLLWLAEALLPPGRGYGAWAFAVPLVLLTLFKAVRWIVDPRLREELGRTIGHPARFGLGGSTEVQIGELFPDSDGISFVPEKAHEAEPTSRD